MAYERQTLFSEDILFDILFSNILIASFRLFYNLQHQQLCYFDFT